MSLDLVVLSADKDQEFALKGLLESPKKLGIQPVQSKLLTHPQRDPGCLRHCHELLRSYISLARFALVVLDVEGSGYGSDDRVALEADVESCLSSNGWRDRSACVAIFPEVEAWVWSPSPLLPQILGWSGRSPSLSDWLAQKGYLQPGQPKPPDPKSALRAALRVARTPASSSLFRELARGVNYSSCQDPAFHKLLDTLKRWFPPE